MVSKISRISTIKPKSIELAHINIVCDASCKGCAFLCKPHAMPFADFPKTILRSASVNIVSIVNLLNVASLQYFYLNLLLLQQIKINLIFYFLEYAWKPLDFQFLAITILHQMPLSKRPYTKARRRLYKDKQNKKWKQNLIADTNY